VIKSLRFVTLLTCAVIVFVFACNLSDVDETPDYNKLLAIDNKLDLKQLLEQANDPGIISKYIWGSYAIEHEEQSYWIWQKKVSAFKLTTLSDTELIKIGLFIDYTALKMMNSAMTDFTLTLYTGENIIDTFTVRENYDGSWYIRKDKFINYIKGDLIEFKIIANYAFVPEKIGTNNDMRELSFIIYDIEKKDYTVNDALTVKYLTKITAICAQTLKTQIYATDFQDEGTSQWSGNLKEIDFFNDHLDLTGNEYWGFIHRTNEIQFGTDIFTIMSFSSDIQFNLALTRGFWDNPDGDINVQVGLCDTGGATDIFNLNIVNAKDDKVYYTWDKQEFIPCANTRYLIHTQIATDGNNKITVYNEDLLVCEFENSINLPAALYSYEFSVNKGTMSIYKYCEYK